MQFLVYMTRKCSTGRGFAQEKIVRNIYIYVFLNFLQYYSLFHSNLTFVTEFDTIDDVNVHLLFRHHTGAVSAQLNV